MRALSGIGLAAWVSGEPFFKIEERLSGARIRTASQSRRYKSEDTVDLCQTAFGFEANLILGALVELLSQLEEGSLVDAISELQRLAKYGVATDVEYTLHEMGFADRVVAKQISELVGIDMADRESLTSAMKERIAELDGIAASWPAVYRARLSQLTVRGEG